MGTHALYAGTFDPPTLGHLDVIRRAAGLFDRLTVGIADHHAKDAMFPAEERVRLVRSCVEGLQNVEVARVRGLVVEACRELGCHVLVRGVRSCSDLELEARMAATNRAISASSAAQAGAADAIDTVLLVASPGVAHLSSTLVRQIARLRGETESLVPPPVAEALRERLRPPPRS